GTLEHLARDTAKEKVRLMGGDVSSSVSKETDYIVAGENPGSKFDDAKKLGVKIISEVEFLNLIS
ncbi:MAG: BRCT domain-containing protein, partial [Patescibacteria group bacterium]